MSTSVSISEPDKQVLNKSSRRVILIEDDPALRNSIAEYLARIGYDVTSVGSGLLFYHAMAEQTFAVAIIDLGLPDIDGLQLVEYVRKNTTMHCIILTARGSVDDRIAGYDCGAELYLVKPVDCRELASALASILQRGIEGGFTKGELCWCLKRQNALLITPAAELISLTARELDFLLCLAETQEETVPRSTILNALGYRDDDFSNRALESLIRRLRRKIEAVAGNSPILTRHGVGYSFSAPLTLN